MSSPQKAVVNGLDAPAASSGFRHQLPQIAVMTRNPKIAQSKTSAKSDVVTAEHSTTEVEGVGKVVHIGKFSLKALIQIGTSGCFNPS